MWKVLKKHCQALLSLGSCQKARGKTNGLDFSVLRESEVILQEPKNVTLEVGQSAFFTCKSHEKLASESTSWVKIEEDIIVLSEGNIQK